MIRNLINDEKRNECIVKIIKWHSERKILVLGSRINHLKNLMEKTKKIFPNKKIIRFFGNETKTTRTKVPVFNFSIDKAHLTRITLNGILYKVTKMSRDKTFANFTEDAKIGVGIQVYAGDIINKPESPLYKFVEKEWKKVVTKLDEYEDPSLEVLNNADIIFGTFQKAEDALDIPNIDTLLYITPFSAKKTIEQSAGRIERYVVGKNKPLVIDIMDLISKFAIKLAEARLKHYKTLGMKEVLATNKLQ